MAESQKYEERPPIPQDVILVGKKPIMSYAMAALMQLTESGGVTIKARGRAISRAWTLQKWSQKDFSAAMP